ncbi:dTDP-4-keto-6-deoxy-D-glucose epimerase [Dermacoccus sp. 147Ba]|uniref:dTDP-4-dehydrorhamnose 3,5-epimerase family protein n=1 Tax=unclassified Dermacoccus TaxID=2643059 RepID=UPI00101D5D58|nr:MULTISPECIES: dTDP-4-dehydrorhamnose 3,5-epimerase family protein [unclassified Dermacoccus]QNK54066.1 dTDP-4-dehydrorhamnose 3,5-epimerase family protein [Dermacoccus sp. PAMC28757]RYI22784.1 dTDP-4-keto-6-deoxy-D-glucose epimerase [Dermacoccus sp. 147Ba]
MQITPLRIEGAYRVAPRQFPDDRGVFMEGFRGDKLAEHIGHEMRVVQTNISVSSRGAVRGIHFADVPPSQAKYVTAVSGSFLDFVVDIRVGSPTFGEWESVRLDTDSRVAVYLSEGLGHCLVALEDNSTAVYLCSQPYNPTGEHGINPLDPRVGLDLPADLEPVVSAKDAAAPNLEEAAAQGLLPNYDDCLALAESLRRA